MRTLFSKVVETSSSGFNCLKIMAGDSNADTKPTSGIVSGSMFIEVDTGDVYMFNEETPEWVKEYCIQEEE